MLRGGNADGPQVGVTAVFKTQAATLAERPRPDFGFGIYYSQLNGGGSEGETLTAWVATCPPNVGASLHHVSYTTVYDWVQALSFHWGYTADLAAADNGVIELPTAGAVEHQVLDTDLIAAWASRPTSTTPRSGARRRCGGPTRPSTGLSHLGGCRRGRKRPRGVGRAPRRARPRWMPPMSSCRAWCPPARDLGDPTTWARAVRRWAFEHGQIGLPNWEGGSDGNPVGVSGCCRRLRSALTSVTTADLTTKLPALATASATWHRLFGEAVMVWAGGRHRRCPAGIRRRRSPQLADGSLPPWLAPPNG
ncbi:MAG: hypothetical protein R3F43_12035 [bacterium]